MSRTIQFSAKCADLFGGTLNVNGESHDLNGYVPYDLGIGGGDYIQMTIDLDTGQIVGFKPPSDQTIQDVIDGEQ